MATNYTITCDFCGLKVSGKEDDWPVKSNHWRVSVGTSWFEPKEGTEHFVMAKETEIEKDACLECAKKISDVIKKILPNP